MKSKKTITPEINQEEFIKLASAMTSAIMPEVTAYTLDSLVSEVRPLQGQGLKKPSMEI